MFYLSPSIIFLRKNCETPPLVSTSSPSLYKQLHLLVFVANQSNMTDESQLFLLLFQLLDFLTCIPNNYSIEYTNVATGRKEWGQVHGSRSAYLFSEAFITSCSRNMIDWSCHALDGYELLSSWLISSYARNQFLWVCSLSFPSHPSSLICF